MDASNPVKRGRVITTGEFASLAKAKQVLLEAEEREVALLAEKKFLEEIAQRRRKAAAFSVLLEKQGVTG